MTKLILTHQTTGGLHSSIKHVPFEYESMDKFLSDMEKIHETNIWKRYGDGSCDFDTSTIDILDSVALTKGDLALIKFNVFTIEDWFKNNQETYIYGK